jgi:hypothetical protein
MDPFSGQAFWFGSYLDFGVKSELATNEWKEEIIR